MPLIAVDRDPSVTRRPNGPRRSTRAGSATGTPRGIHHEAWQLGGARSSGQRRRTSPACDALVVRGRGASTGSLDACQAWLCPAEELLDRVLGRDRVDREPRPELETGDLTQARMDLPVPVVGGIDLF